MEGLKTGKIFTWPTFRRDHTRFLSMLPGYLAAYLIPGMAIDPTITESVMLTMNSYNTCPYCTGLHGQLGRMAGVDEIDTSSPAVVYAKTFAIESGRGPDVDAAYDQLTKEVGSMKSSSIRSLCWALLWGKTTGNTINSARDKLIRLEITKISPLEIIIFFWYGPLFAVIGILNFVLKFSPPLPKSISSALGVVLWVPQAINIAPMGILCFFLSGLRIC